MSAEPQPDQSNNAQPASITNVSGGVSVAAEQVQIGGDAVGRDKVTQIDVADLSIIVTNSPGAIVTPGAVSVIQSPRLDKEKQGCLADVRKAQSCIVCSDILGAARQIDSFYCKIRQSEPGWGDEPDVIAAANEAKAQLNNTCWQQVVLEEAARWFAGDQCRAAWQLIKLVLRLDSANQLAHNFEETIELAQAYGLCRNGEESVPIDGREYHERPDGQPNQTLPQTLTPLLNIHREYSDVLNDLIGKLLAKLIPQRPDRFLEELDQYPLAVKLLNEPAPALALRDLRDASNQAAIIDRLLHRTTSHRLWYETTCIAKNRPAEAFPLKDWLRRAEFFFNPFGPEQAESDPLLPNFVVDFAVKRVYGARSILAWGEPGAGRTATALLLAYNCYDPSMNPREPSTFPVYYAPPVAIPEFVDRRWCLASLAHTIAHRLSDYLTNVPNRFQDLPPSRQKRLGRLLFTCAAGSRRQLQRQLRESPASAMPYSLTSAIENLDLEIRVAGGLDEQDWLDLLRDSLPSGFSSLYVLVDVSAGSQDITTFSKWLNSLIGLIVPLQTVGLYLKIFVPEELRSRITERADVDHVPLSWSTDNLRLMLRERIRGASRESPVAGRESLDALCDPGARDMRVDEFLIEAAKTPRDIVHWGNRLLQIHVDNDRENPQLTERDIKQWQGELLHE